MRTVPRSIHSHFSQQSQTLGASTRRPYRDRTVLQNLLRPAPRLPRDFAPVSEVSREEDAKGTRFDLQIWLLKVSNPYLLRLKSLPARARSRQWNELSAFTRDHRLVRGIYGYNPI